MQNVENSKSLSFASTASTTRGIAQDEGDGQLGTFDSAVAVESQERERGEGNGGFGRRGRRIVRDLSRRL